MSLTIAMIVSFLAVRGFRFLVTDKGFALTNTESFNWLLLFLFFSAVIFQSFREPDRKLKLYSLLFAFITAVCYSLGICYQKRETLTWVWENGSNLVNFVNLAFSHFTLYFCAAFLLNKVLRDRSDKQLSQNRGTFSFRRAFLFWGILLVFYIPWYLYCYPGIMTYDSGDQIIDAITPGTLSDHHSAFLDLLLRAILVPIRNLTGSLQIGMGICSFLQLAAMTFIFALTYERIRYHLSSRLLRALIFLWFAVFPVNTLYSVTIWKDIPFSLCFLVLMLCIDFAAEDQESFFRSIRKQITLMLSLFLLPLMRHNGILITILMSLCLMIRFKPFIRQVLKICGSAFLLLGIWNFIIMPALHVSNVGAGLMLSLPQQQIARTLLNHHNEMDPEDVSALANYFDVPEIWNEYTGILSDPVKDHFREDRYNENRGLFFARWFRLGLRYPIDYLEAFFHNNYGYWFPETRYWISSYGVIVHGPIEDLHTAPIYKAEVIENIYNRYAYHQELKTPLLPLLFSRGACWWVWVFCGLWCLYQNRRKFILFLPGLFLWMSVLISPVYNEFRYVYGLFIGLPLLLCSTLKPSHKE